METNAQNKSDYKAILKAYQKAISHAERKKKKMPDAMEEELKGGFIYNI